MNYFRDMLNNSLYDLEDDIDNLFEQFVDEVNSQPFNTEHDPSFRLNQSVINNMYLLRRTMDLYPEELGSRQRRRHSRSHPINVSINHSNGDGYLTTFFDNQYILSTQSTPVNQTPPYNTPIGTSPHTRRVSIETTSSSLPGIYQRRNAIDATSFDNVWLNDFSRRFTDNLFNSLFTNFNDFIEEQLQNYNDLEDVKVTLTEDEFNQLDTNIDESLLSDNVQCNICLDELNKEDSLVKLKCNHIYHTDCIKEWLTKQSTKCPNCRFCCRDGLKTE